MHNKHSWMNIAGFTVETTTNLRKFRGNPCICYAGFYRPKIARKICYKKEINYFNYKLWDKILCIKYN